MSPETRQGTFSVLPSFHNRNSVYISPRGASNVFVFFRSPEAGAEVLGILFFILATGIKHLGSEGCGVCSHLILKKIKASVFSHLIRAAQLGG